jgi:ubiquinone/menaquinone biosynthesis C-methylase UbiE
MSTYIFDNAAEEPTTQRFASLETLYDLRTVRFLEGTGVGPDWRCLEVGAGGGSIAAWLADRVGPAGHVLVTDIDPRFLAALAAGHRPNVEVIRHDVRVNQLPEGQFDLVHARLVLVHVPQAAAALARLAAALRPGGWLVIEDFDPTFIDRAFPTANGQDAVVGRKAFAALGELLVARGAERGWGRSLYQRLVELGLSEVGMEVHLEVRPGGSVGARLDAANFVQVGEAAVATGLITAEELDRMLTLLDDPGCAFASQTMFTAWGRRP